MIELPTSTKNLIQNLNKIEESIAIFQSEENVKNYFKNIKLNSPNPRNIKTIVINLQENTLFKFGDISIRKKVFKILSENNPIKKLSVGEIFKLYLYLYNDQIEEAELKRVISKYSEEPFSIDKEKFIQFILDESQNIYKKWNFPLNIKEEYKLFHEITIEITDKEKLKYLSPIILILGRYINMKNYSDEMKNLIRNEMRNVLPQKMKTFFIKNKEVKIEKAERISDNIFISLKGRDVIAITMGKNKEIKGIDLLDVNRYKRIIESEIGKFKAKGKYKDIKKKLKESGYRLNWYEMNKNKIIMGVLLFLILTISIGFCYWKFFMI